MIDRARRDLLELDIDTKRSMPLEESCAIVHSTPGIGIEDPAGVRSRSSLLRIPLRVRDAAFWRTLAAIVAIGSLYFAPRYDDIHRVMTVDEPLWLGRSANFLDGLLFLHPLDTYQFAHPGVMTMWMGAIAFLVTQPQFILHDFTYTNQTTDIHQQLRAYGIDPLQMLVSARTVKLILQTALFIVAILTVDRLFGRRIAIGTALTIAFDPFLIGHDRLLHIDGLLAISSFAAVLAFIRAWRLRISIPHWIAAGVLFTVTCLTRTVGGIMLPVFVAVTVLPEIGAVLRRHITLRQFWYRIRMPVKAFGIAAILTAFLLWPALLWAPGLVASRVVSWSLSAAEEGHELPTVFNGRIVSGDPGAIFYPESILWRATPFVLAGVALFLLGWICLRDRFVPRPIVGPLLILVSFAVAYVLLMTCGAKKFDRYVLPVYPILDLVAAIGWIGLAEVLWQRRNAVGRVLCVAVVALAAGGQVDAARRSQPYGLDYYDPLMGGMHGAETAMLVGWGEGMDQAAGYILAQPGGETAQVRTSANRNPLLYFLPPTVTVYPYGIASGPLTIPEWATTDYYVSYTLQWQRDLYPEILDQLAKYPADFTGTIDGEDVVRVYRMQDIPPPPAMIRRLGCTWAFGDRVQLLTYTDARQTYATSLAVRASATASAMPTPSPTMTPTPPSVPTPTATVAPATTVTPIAPVDLIPVQIPTPSLPTQGDRTVTLFFATGSAASPSPVTVTVRFTGRGSFQAPITATTTLTPSSVPGALRSATVNVDFPNSRTTSDYDIDVSLSDAITGKPLASSIVTSNGASTPGPADLGDCGAPRTLPHGMVNDDEQENVAPAAPEPAHAGRLS